MPFKLASPFPLWGDQPQAMEKLLDRLVRGARRKRSTRLGVTDVVTLWHPWGLDGPSQLNN